MSTHKNIERICCVAIAFALVLTIALLHAESLGIEVETQTLGYETRLFDTESVHTIDIVMEDWEGFLETCTNEEYSLCSVVIDNEAYKNVGIRAKGNTSLTQVASYGNDRYSFKIEFDHYDSTKSYYGLDKLSLNNIIQDNTYMKDYLTYQMMGYFGVDAPLCSYVFITVNGEPWGLYLAVEGVEEAFLTRNYGSDYGELYKPDSQSMGGGRGNGNKFNMEDWQIGETESQQEEEESFSFAGGRRTQGRQQEGGQAFTLEQIKNMLDTMTESELQTLAETLEYADGETMLAALDAATSITEFLNGHDITTVMATLLGDMDVPNRNFESSGGNMPFGGGGMMGSNDVSLVYTDDEYSSYQNIFDNAKTDITDADKDRLIGSLKQLNAYENIEQVVDVDAVIRYFVVHNFVCNFDSYTGSMIHNYYLYEEDGQLSMIPWDYNLAFGGFQSAQDATELVNYPIDTPVSGGTTESRPMLAWIFADETYTQLYHQYFQEFIASYFDSGYFETMIEEVRELISPYVEADPTKFCTYEEFETGIATLKTFCLLRAESINGQLDGTIPSTSDGQAQDESALVDASNIQISDMGSMNNSMGGGIGFGGEKGSFMPMWETQDAQEEPAAPGEAGNTPPDKMDGMQENQQPEFQQSEGETPSGMQQGSVPSMEGAWTAESNGMPKERSEAGTWEQKGGTETLDGGQTSQTPVEHIAFNIEEREQQNDNAAGSTNAEEWGMLGACAAVLLGGILMALFYRKRV